MLPQIIYKNIHICVSAWLFIAMQVINSVMKETISFEVTCHFSHNSHLVIEIVNISCNTYIFIIKQMLCTNGESSKLSTIYIIHKYTLKLYLHHYFF